jgi:hypothetical protein
MAKVGAKPGIKKSAKHKAAISKSQHGKNNSNWKHGKRIEYRLRVGLKPNDGKIVQHKNGKRHGLANNKKSNLQVINDKPKSGTKKAGRNNTPLHGRLTHKSKAYKK